MASSSSFDDFRRRANAVRCIPLAAVLARWGAEPDQWDRSRWRTPLGPLSVTGDKFFNWHVRRGGGGAIDLVMHLSGCDAEAAVEWLEQQLGSAAATSASTPTPASAGKPAPAGRTIGAATATSAPAAISPASPTSISHASSTRRALSSAVSNVAGQHQPGQLRLPKPDRAQLGRVRRYLAEQRHLAPHILEPLVEAGKLYADHRGNAVFLMVAGKDNHPIGAELRGTRQSKWRGLAPGTRKDRGYFWIGEPRSARIILCESTIDAISCNQLHLEEIDTPCICISTAGVRSHLPWLPPLIARGYDIFCGFDADQPGETAACHLINRHPSIQRLRPPAHDWNDALTARR